MTRYCDQCGKKLKEHALFCSNCGAKCDLPPETSVEKKQTEKKVENKVNETKDDVISKTNNANMLDFNNLDLHVVAKYSLAATVLSLILGIVFVIITMNTATRISLLGSDLGMLPYSFYLALIIVVAIMSAHIKEGINVIVMGLVSGLLTGILQSPVFEIFYGFSWNLYIGNQTLLLIILGIVFAYLGNIYFKEKINLPIINQYLGE